MFWGSHSRWGIDQIWNKFFSVLIVTILLGQSLIHLDKLVRSVDLCLEIINDPVKMCTYLKIQKYKCRDGEVFSKLPGKLIFGMKVYSTQLAV